jgi:SSS family solute:Na+ symporter
MQPVAGYYKPVPTPPPGMSFFDWSILCAYFALMIGMGLWAQSKIKNANDSFTAGGAMPWWLSGISHHMSGYSSAAFDAKCRKATRA